MASFLQVIATPPGLITLVVFAMAIVLFVTGFIPNTPIVATLLPVLEGWCHRRRISPSKVLLPLSFATVLGGMAREGYLTEVLVPKGSELIGQTLHASRLQRRFDVDVLELQRGSEIFGAPLAERVLQGGRSAGAALQRHLDGGAAQQPGAA
jgi:di/tricarboxylate transporter